MADATLDALLARAASGVPVPDADTFARRVADRVRAGAPTRAVARPPWRRPLWVVIALAVVIAIVIAALPATRSAVADWLSIGGVRIQSGSTTVPHTTVTLTTTPGTDAFAGLDLGTRMTLADAAAQVDVPVALPTVPGYEHPDAVYVRTPPRGGIVTLVYAPTPQRPATPAAPVGALLSEFRGTVDPVFFKKIVGPGTTVDFVQVGGQPGYWISGDLHEVVFTDEDGNARTDTTRLAANTLLWTRGGVTFRLESALSERDAVALAESIP